ncbi:tripeptidyl peptidase A [Infundibulicybe gibba]|nr:tripeptidyl peptidase A [Infundibulicybe gibba]
MRIPLCFLTLALMTIPSAWAAPSVERASTIKESVNAPRGWVRRSNAPAEHEVKLRIALPQPNFRILEKHLYEVSDPFHEHYGAHLSKEEVDSLVAPHQESIDLVDEWLLSHGLSEAHFERSPAKDWIVVRVPVSLAEKMLDTKYHVWEHITSGEYLVRTTSYSLPQHLHEHIEVIQPTTIFARWKGMKSTLHYTDHVEEKTIANPVAPVMTPSGPVDASCNVTITITCLQQLYNAVGYKPQAVNKNQIGITGYLEEFANIEDLQTFFADQRPDALNSSFKFISVAGGLNSQNLSEAGVEANLDVQFAFGLSHPTPGTFWSTAGRPPFLPDLRTPTDTNEPYADWLDFVLAHPNTPQVISTSYGDDEQTVPESYARRACAGFAQLGARGVSLMFSSGDGGVGDGSADPASHQCFTNDGRNATRFLPLFPASCPYVTAVGGTNNVPEVAVFFSGGGFSDYFSRPAYQDAAGTYQGLFNRTGRAIPDVAAQGRRFRVFVGGKPISVGGTSASSPTFAGLVTLLNDARLARHLPVLGFLNPLLYTRGLGGFNDITQGNNPGCGTPGFNVRIFSPDKYYLLLTHLDLQATKGWDPITGLGTPNFGKLKDIVTRL